jgi:hypothetical protein
MRFSSLVVALSMLVSSPPAAIADALSAEQESFVTVTLASLIVPIKCNGYEIIDGGLRSFGDAAGVEDGDRLFRAVIAAFSAANGGEYDRGDLVPEVTRKLNEVGVQIPKDGKFKSFCKKWGGMLIANHVARPK